MALCEPFNRLRANGKIPFGRCVSHKVGESIGDSKIARDAGKCHRYLTFSRQIL